MDILKSPKRYMNLRDDGEVRKHSGIVMNLDLTIQQEEYQGAEIKDWSKDK